MNREEFEKNEIYLISKIFQSYYCMGIYEIAEEDETAKAIFEKIGLIEVQENENNQRRRIGRQRIRSAR